MLDAPARLVVLLAHVRDPGNAGSVLRAADAAGADAVLVSSESWTSTTPRAVRASVGSLFHLPVVTGVDLLRGRRGAARAPGCACSRPTAAGGRTLDDEAGRGRPGRRPPLDVRQRGLGSARRAAALADEAVRVPIHGRAESLNLATAAAVCLYASARAQRTGAGSGTACRPRGWRCATGCSFLGTSGGAAHRIADALESDLITLRHE